MNGHIFFNCKKPITSIGIIGIKFNKTIQKYEYLLIRRKDSLGYVDFIRGKYNINNIEYIINIINEMTNYEKTNIITKEFDVLWKELWGGETLGSKYMHEKKISREKLQTLRTGLIIQGKIINETADQVLVQTRIGQLKLDKAYIMSIVFTIRSWIT